MLRVPRVRQVLVETDAPYLTPHPYRGRPNAPYLVAATARAVADARTNVCVAVQQASLLGVTHQTLDEHEAADALTARHRLHLMHRR